MMIGILIGAVCFLAGMLFAVSPGFKAMLYIGSCPNRKLYWLVPIWRLFWVRKSSGVKWSMAESQRIKIVSALELMMKYPNAHLVMSEIPVNGNAVQFLVDVKYNGSINEIDFKFGRPS